MSAGATARGASVPARAALVRLISMHSTAVERIATALDRPESAAGVRKAERWAAFKRQNVQLLSANCHQERLKKRRTDADQYCEAASAAAVAQSLLHFVARKLVANAWQRKAKLKWALDRMKKNKRSRSCTAALATSGA